MLKTDKKGIPLRNSLVIVIVLLMLAGLLTSAGILAMIMRQYFLSKVDYSLESAAYSWGTSENYEINYGDDFSTSYFVHIENKDNQVIFDNYNKLKNPPILNFDDIPNGHPITVSSTDGHTAGWRVFMVSDRKGTIVLAINLSRVYEVINKMLNLQIWINLSVLFVGVLMAWILIKRNLRKLDEISETAAKIAGGNLSIRIPSWPINTEVGKLSDSLNRMLSRLQQDFIEIEKSKEEATKLSARMQQFIVDASHELRTPLTSIRGFAELYRQGAVDDPKWVLSKIESESERMTSLVEDMFVLVRSGEANAIHFSKVNLYDLASECVQSSLAVYPDRKISLTKHKNSDETIVLGDKTKLTQIISNYISNAIKYTPEKARIRLYLEVDQQTVTIFVKDNGQGLKPEDKEHIFERFYRADTSRTRETGGSGLGLSIVEMLAKIHNGAVGVESKPGSGCLFWVKLPKDPNNFKVL